MMIEIIAICDDYEKRKPCLLRALLCIVPSASILVLLVMMTLLLMMMRKRIKTMWWRLLRHVSPVLSSLSVFKRLVAPDLKLDQKIFSFQAINSEICDLSYCCCILKEFILWSHGAQPFFCTNQRHLENVVKTSGEVGKLPRYQFEMVADL